MYLPQLHPISNSQYQISGSVTIHPSAAIAPGVLLQADPESQIIIAAGVCIGMGAVLHAHQGVLQVNEGANIGSGVLIVGKGKIGNNTCIGAMTTIFNSSVEPGEVVAPGSVIGDTSRQITNQKPVNTPVPPSLPTPQVSEQIVEIAPVSELLPQQVSESRELSTVASNNSSAIEPQNSLEDAAIRPVAGQANLNRLLSKLLPHRQALSRPLNEDQSPPNSS